MQMSHVEQRVSREVGESLYIHLNVTAGIGEFSHACEGKTCE